MWSTNIKPGLGGRLLFSPSLPRVVFNRPALIACLIVCATAATFDTLQAGQGNRSTTLREAEVALDKRQYDRVLSLVDPLIQDDSTASEFRRLKIKALTRSGRPTDAFGEYGRLEANLGRDDESILREVAMGFITTLLMDMREQMRGAAYTALKELESEETVPYLVGGLTDGSGLVRTLAAEGLGRLKKGRESLRLRQALEDQAAMVRVAALKGMGRSGDPTAVALVEKYLKDEQPTVRVAASGALARLGREDALGRLREAASASNPDERGAVFRMLGDLRDQGAITILEQGLGDTQPSVRGAAATALSELGAADAAGAIEVLLTDPVPAVRAAAAVSIGELQVKQSVPSLKRSLEDSNPAVRAAGVDALLHVGSGFEDVSGTVRDLTQSTDPGIRASAAKALGRSRADASLDALGVLRVLLNDPVPRPRIAAARALGHLREADRAELITVLKQSLIDQDEAVRATGAGALGRILAISPVKKPSKPK